MKLDSRRLQRRNNLRQDTSPDKLLHHSHAYWREINYSLFTGDNRYTNNSFRSVGARVYLNPVVLMYIVRAKLVITSTFAGTPDQFCVNLVIGSNAYSRCTDRVFTFENWEIDITDEMLEFFKNFREEECYIQVKVSNIAVPLDLTGAYLRFTIYGTDTYGDYANVTQPMLIDESDINKSYIRLLDEESKSFEYLSGVRPL